MCRSMLRTMYEITQVSFVFTQHMEKLLNERSTKKDLWEAYEKLVEMRNAPQKSATNEDGAGKEAREVISAEKRADISCEKVVEILDDVRRIAVDTTTRFHDEYVVLHREMEHEKEKLYSEIKHARNEWKREQEEYAYKMHSERRKEEDEYALKVRDKERQFSEKFSIKEKELSEREQNVKAKEEELRQFQVRAEAFPKELEKTVHGAEGKVREEMEQKAKIEASLVAKDTEREREVGKLKVQNLEDSIKLRSVQITNLERQLAQANEQIQKLAVTVVESGSGMQYKKTSQEYEKQGTVTE